MKNVYLTMFLFVTMVIQSNTVFAEKIAVTTKSDGFKKVILKNDGTVITWVYSDVGGDSSSVKTQLTNVKTVFIDSSL